ncbi:MAG: hypothetical protein SVV67_10420 [Bacillota bacterium]|nr:hypothetical protein [Bacillota bacterium]
MDKPLSFALCLGLSGGVVWTLLHFLTTGEFTWLGVVFFITATAVACVAGLLIGKAKKN